MTKIKDKQAIFLTPSERAYDFIKRKEGLRLKAYYCDAGVLTIGYGHTTNVHRGMEITENVADQLFRDDMLDVIDVLNKNIEFSVRDKITQGQIDALCSFIFNFGETKFHNSTLLKKINAGNIDAAAHELLRWNKARDPETGQLKVLAGLDKRRQEEFEMYQYG